jgi:PKD repeat protein
MKSKLQSGFYTILPAIMVLLFAGFTGKDNPKSTLISGGELTFTVRTVTQNGTYAPKNVFAIWIEDADGFVKTRKAMANQRKQYLYTWKAASDYNVVDAITGSTLTSHQTHTVAWDCTDLDGNIVPDGNYTVWVEFTEKHAQGPLYSLTFTKGPNAQSISPEDQPYFKDIQLDFVPLVADFSSDVSEICQGETVTFTNLSIGATNWNWNFGNGASPASATGEGPHAINYNTPGAKTVSLTINNSLTENKADMITVNASPTAEFSFSGVNYTVEFSNNSMSATSYLWDFGDGFTSTDVNPSHYYAAAGSYSVSLTASYISCTDDIIHEVSVPLVGINSKIIINTETLSVSPNPSTGAITITFNELILDAISVTIFNAIGKVMHNSIIENIEEKESMYLDLSGYPKGIYFIDAESNILKANKKIILN